MSNEGHFTTNTATTYIPSEIQRARRHILESVEATGNFDGALAVISRSHIEHILGHKINIEEKSMSIDEKQVEQEIQDKGLTAPRLTPDLIDAKIAGTQYHVFYGTTLTVCCMLLKNGFTVTGESACASPENYDRELGEKIAYKNAREKIWALEGYLLREQLSA